LLVHGYYDFQNPPYMASRQLLITQIAAASTSFRPLPCQAWHGYRVTNAHCVEVEVGADGHVSAPPSWAAAVAPPAGAALLPPLARPSCTLDSCASLRTYPGSHSLLFGVHGDRVVHAWSQSPDPKGRGGAKIIRNLPYRVFRRRLIVRTAAKA
jgi:hypothetical protein